jgi:hypothetical protein
MIQLAVIQRGPDWAVMRDGALVQDGLSRSQAIRIVDALAFDLEETCEVEVLVQDYSGELHGRYSGTEAQGMRPSRSGGPRG